MSRDRLMTAIDELMREVFGRYLRPKRKPPDLDLTLAQLHCLRMIGRMGSPSMSELSAELYLQPSTTTALVDALVEHGLVQRQEDVEDRRVVRAELTAEGRRRRDSHRRAARQRLMALLGDLEDEELRQIHEALTLLHGAALRRGDGWDGAPPSREREEDESS